MFVRRAYAIALFAALPLATSCSSAPVSSVPAFGSAHDQSAGRTEPQEKAVCPDLGEPGVAYCTAVLRGGTADGGPSGGYVPSDLWSAYKLPAQTGGSGQTVAVIDAFDDPDVEGDLFTYRNTFGLPVCSTLNGCFIRLNQKGKAGPYPRADSSWATEISIDVEMVSAICPNCHIMLVEANSSGWRDLEASVGVAAKLGANVIGNAYGGNGGANAADYDHPGSLIVATGGGSGFYTKRDYEPSEFPTVVAVGGTTLTQGGSGRGWSEKVYDRTGSGCSKFAKPPWQTDKGCKHRTANDVAAVADPSTGVAIYNSYSYGGWEIFGGGSVASDIITGVYGLAGNASQLTAAQSLYAPGSQAYLNDVTTGIDGICKPAYLCSGEVGYDGPSGMGTPNGVGAF